MRLDSTLAIWPLPPNWAQIAPHYREALADVPADLVDMALRHVRLTSKWLPKPSEIREPIARLLELRQRAHADRARRNRDNARQILERDQWLATWMP